MKKTKYKAPEKEKEMRVKMIKLKKFNSDECVYVNPSHISSISEQDESEYNPESGEYESAKSTNIVLINSYGYYVEETPKQILEMIT